RIRRTEFRGYVLLCAFLIQAVEPVDGRSGHDRLHKESGREGMRPGQRLGIRSLEIGFAIPKVVRSDGIAESIEGPAVHLVPRAMRKAEEDLVIVGQAVVAAKSDRSLIGVGGRWSEVIIRNKRIHASVGRQRYHSENILGQR